MRKALSKISWGQSQVVRGLAIIGVLVIHGLAFIPGIYTGEHQFWVVILDQMARVSVPAFLVMSGYGLAATYEAKQLSGWRFVWRRLNKILPAYVWWSLASLVVFWMVPGWGYDNKPKSLLIQLLFGQADYHLYFVPILLQLYVLFPWLYRMTRKSSWWMVGLIIIQLMTYQWFASNRLPNERWEYGLFLSWVAYFGWGIWWWKREMKVSKLWGLVAWPLAGLVVAVADSWTKLKVGVDPLLALKFTRWPSLVWSMTVLTWLIGHGRELVKAPAIKAILRWLGRNSYVIYLSHVMAMRIGYAAVTSQIPALSLVGVVLIWIMSVAVTHRMMR